MSAAQRVELRELILAAASARFATTGFRGTSLQDIAGAAGCAKASVLYHFDSKDAILAALLAPAVAELAELDVRLAALDDLAAQRSAIAGFVDLAVRFRRELAVIHADITDILRQDTFCDLQQMSDRLLDTISARSAEPRTRIAALVVLAGVPAACLQYAHISDDELRRALTAIAAAALGIAPS